MSSMNLPLEIYDILERKLGRDEAMPVAKAIEASLSRIERRSYDLANQRKLEVKDELKVELRGATKADIAELRGEIKVEMIRMDKKFTVLFLVAISSVILLVRILGLAK